MSSVARPSTPMASPAPAPSTPQTGTWRHPRYNEVARRQAETTFTDRNIRRIVFNGGALILMWIAEKWIRSSYPSIAHATAPLRPYLNYAYIVIRIMLLINIGFALRPLVRKDDLSDIPLTPGQRKLLGLTPSSKPLTPGSQYTTPPRYPRSSTPLSGSPSSSYSNSPASAKDSAGGRQNSPFSPGASPLLHKAVAGGLGGGRRSSYGSPSPLGPGAPKAGAFGEAPGTPTPGVKSSSVAINNKWLWEKGRRSSGGSRMFS